MHGATGMGDAEMLEILIDRGGDVNAVNTRGQTPLQIVAASRAMSPMEQAQAAMKSMGVKIPACRPAVNPTYRSRAGRPVKRF